MILLIFFMILKLILTDMIESKKEGKWDKGPFNALLTNLVRYLAGSLPSLTLKTGFGAKTRRQRTAGSAASRMARGRLRSTRASHCTKRSRSRAVRMRAEPRRGHRA